MEHRSCFLEERETETAAEERKGAREEGRKDGGNQLRRKVEIKKRSFRESSDYNRPDFAGHEHNGELRVSVTDACLLPTIQNLDQQNSVIPGQMTVAQILSSMFDSQRRSLLGLVHMYAGVFLQLPLHANRFLLKPELLENRVKIVRKCL